MPISERLPGSTLGPKTRNPFSGKGLAVCVCLLREPREWSISALAECAEVSQPFASMVVRELRRLDLVEGEVTRGRTAAIRGTRRLATQVGLQWPRPRVGVIGRLPDDGPVGGGPAHRAAGIVTMTMPRRYVRTPADAEQVLGRWGGLLAEPDAGDYQIVVLDASLPAGLVSPIIVALELGTTPRGRETLRAHAGTLLAGLPV